MNDKFLYSRKYGNEPIDMKLLFIYFVRNIRYVVYSTIIGCVVFALGYYLVNFVLVKEHRYVATGEMYLEYATDVRLENIYINDYTWQNLVHTDKAVVFVQEQLSFNISEEELKASVTAGLVSDVRFVTLKVTTDNPEHSVQIAQAYQEAIIRLAEEMVDIERVVVFTNADSATKIQNDNRTFRMACTGAILGAVISSFAIIWFFTMDDSIYVPFTIERRFALPVIGVFHDRTARELGALVRAEEVKAETARAKRRKQLNRTSIGIAKMNLRKCCEGCMDIAVMDVSIYPKAEAAYETLLHLKLLNEQDELTDIARGDLEEGKACFSAPNFRMDYKAAFEEKVEMVSECAKYDGTILLIRAGEHNTKIVERAINVMKKQGCNIVGALLYDADAWMLNLYYYRPITLKNRVQNTEEEEE